MIETCGNASQHGEYVQHHQSKKKAGADKIEWYFINVNSDFQSPESGTKYEIHCLSHVPNFLIAELGGHKTTADTVPREK